MANSVTFPAEYGGDGKTYTDDADPNTGLDGTGYMTRFVPALAGAVAMGAFALQKAQETDADRQQVGQDKLAVAADRQIAAEDRAAVEANLQDAEARIGSTQELLEARDAAAGSAGAAEQSANLAGQKAGDAQTAQTGAEAARDAAALTGNVYADTATGLAATADGQYFTARDPSAPLDFLILYRNDAGSATQIETYPTAAAMDESVQIAYAQRAIVSIVEQRIRWNYDLNA